MANVSTVMNKHIIGVSPNAKLYSALKLMDIHHVNMLPVIHDRKLVGILLKRDIKEGHMKLVNELLVKDVMSYEDIFVEESQGINDAAKIMIKKHIARLPVVNDKKDMVCVGIITSTDIVSLKK